MKILMEQMEKTETARLLMKTFRQLDKAMHADMFRHMPEKQKPSQIFVMMHLRKAVKNGCSSLRVSEIASSLGISMPGVTQLLGGLETCGYIRREMDPDDRRAVRVFMTESGEKMMQPAIAHLENRIFGLIDHLGEENARKLVDLLLETERYFTEAANSEKANSKDKVN